VALDMATIIKRLGLDPKEAFRHVNEISESQARIAANTEAIGAHLGQIHAFMAELSAAIAVQTKQLAELQAAVARLSRESKSPAVVGPHTGYTELAREKEGT
jgi:hypothetical protein